MVKFIRLMLLWGVISTRKMYEMWILISKGNCFYLLE